MGVLWYAWVAIGLGVVWIFVILLVLGMCRVASISDEIDERFFAEMARKKR